MRGGSREDALSGHVLRRAFPGPSMAMATANRQRNFRNCCLGPGLSEADTLGGVAVNTDVV